MMYIKKSKARYLSKFYYLEFWKKYFKDETTIELI